MIKSITSLWAILGFVLSSYPVYAEDVKPGKIEVSKENIAAGKTKSEVCNGCHGVNGMSVDPKLIPNLAGQYADYIYYQTREFQEGHRHDDTMSAMSALVSSEDDLKDIAAYYSSLKMMTGTNPTSPLAKQGKQLYLRGIPKIGLSSCVSCHGKNGKGNGTKSTFIPVIGGQQKMYLQEELMDFKTGLRPNGPSGHMGDLSKKMSDVEIQALAEYLSGL